MRHSRSETRKLAAVAGRCGAVGSLVLLGGCQAGVLDPQGPIGAADRTILLDAIGIMLCIVVPTILATLAFAWWFRAGNDKATHLPNWTFSGKIELVTWSVPLLTIIFLGGIAWVGSHDLDPYKPLESKTKALDVQVVSMDWKWLFIYPDQGIASVNRLVIPVGTPIHLSLTSATVMNTFFVAQLGSMIYTMNGMEDQLYLQADQPGTYHGMSGHFSGDGFADMHFPADAVPADQFQAWVSGAKANGPALDAAAYRQLSKQTIEPSRTYSSLEPDLFMQIVSQKLPPGEGPMPAISSKNMLDGKTLMQPSTAGE